LASVYSGTPYSHLTQQNAHQQFIINHQNTKIKQLERIPPPETQNKQRKTGRQCHNQKEFHIQNTELNNQKTGRQTAPRHGKRTQAVCDKSLLHLRTAKIAQNKVKINTPTEGGHAVA
jgi:hypothetical protein